MLTIHKFQKSQIFLLHFSCECLLLMLTEFYDGATIVNICQQAGLGQSFDGSVRLRYQDDICTIVYQGNIWRWYLAASASSKLEVCSLERPLLRWYLRSGRTSTRQSSPQGRPPMERIEEFWKSCWTQRQTIAKHQKALRGWRPRLNDFPLLCQ